MGTSAAINVRTADGNVAHIICNYDGYTYITGALLLAYYNSFEKAKELLKCGDIYQLEEKLPNKQFIETLRKEVDAQDISKMPGCPYNYNDYEDEKELIRTVIRSMNNKSMYNHVAYRSQAECITLPIYIIADICENNKIVSKNNSKFRAKKGFGMGEYTYLFDEAKGKWFEIDYTGKAIGALESLMNEGWTVETYKKEREINNKKALNNVKRLRAAYTKLQKMINDRKKQQKGTVKVYHKPQTVRELNDWLKRQGVRDRLRVRTLTKSGYKFVALQELTSKGDWQIRIKCDIDNYYNIFDYLKSYLFVDWQM